MPLLRGDTVGPYKIVGLLGGGGGGDVYRAYDTRLGRDLAVKVLREESDGDAGRLRRFEQEARAASALNHPNIVAVYDVGSAPLAGRHHPVPYLAMELLDGEPLSSALAKRRFDVRRCLEVAVPLADALARAHESGIIHRDLKPSNIIMTARGDPKIVDFGIAKLRANGVETGWTAPGTTEDTLTSPGALLGTVGYMSPEQARGEPATIASDQFSFGCILYEMLTGRKPFSRGSQADTLSAILRDDPEPVGTINPAVPVPLGWIVERCLAKSAADRYVSTRDLARELRTLRERAADLHLVPKADPAPRRPGRAVALIGLAAVALVIVGGVLLARREPFPPEPEFRPLTFRDGTIGRALFAPNSNAILYTAAWDGSAGRTYQTMLESGGLDRGLDAEVQLPMAYSGDGSQVLVLLGAFRPNTVVRGTLAWWPSLGGKARRVLDDAGWADWAERGRFFAVVRDRGAERVLETRSAEGAAVRTLHRTAGGISFVRISPDERHVAFIHHPSIFDGAGEVWVARTDGSDVKALTPRLALCEGLDWNRRTGEIWFTGSRSNFWGGALWSVGLSQSARARHALPGYFLLQSVSPAGDAVLLREINDDAVVTVRRPERPLSAMPWFGWTVVTDLSPDERSVLFFDGGGSEKTFGTWIRPLDGGDAVRLGEGVPSRFSPDGQWIVAPTEPPDGPPQLALIPVGAGERRQLSSSPRARHGTPSFAGQNTILFVRSLEEAPSEVWAIETDGTRARPLGAAGCDMPTGDPSSREFLCIGDAGRALVVHSMTGGAGRRLFTLPGSGRIKYARWSRNGDEVHAVTSDRRWLAVSTAKGDLRRDEPLPLSGAGAYDTVIGAAFNADATIQLYTVIHLSGRLYLMTGLDR